MAFLVVWQGLNYVKPPFSCTKCRKRWFECIRSKLSLLLAFFAIYVVALLGTTAVMMTIGYNVTNSVTISLSCINNVGLPLNELGPDMTWNDLPFLAKWMCSLLMLMGRLEIFNVLLLLTPSYWKDN